MSKHKKTGLFGWIKRIGLTLFFLELLYLLVLNIALNIPFTQTFINSMKPQKFQISWERAWTLYPFSVYVENVSAHGATRSQQWQAEVKKASASVELLPLLNHKVVVDDVRAEDAQYLQRSITKPGEDASRMAAYFPPMESMAITKDVSSQKRDKKPKKEKKPWKITVDDIVAHGHHAFWINHLKGDLDGELRADVRVETKGGPFSLHNGKADINLNSLHINDDQMVLEESEIFGNIEISPVIFKENKKLKMLKFFTFDIDIKAQMGNLDFLDMYLHSIKEMQLDGKGLMNAHINFDKGTLLAGTSLKVDANELSMAMLDHEVQGNGQVKLNVTQEKPDELDIKVLFDDLQAYFEKSGTALFSGKELYVGATGNTSLFPETSKVKKVSALDIDIPSVKVEDLGQFQRYLPEKWRFKLYEGEGVLQAKAQLYDKYLNAKLQLGSTQAHVGISDRHFTSDLDVLLNFDMNTSSSLKADISGSYISLINSKLFNQNKSDSKESTLWDTRLNIANGTLDMPLPEWLKGKKRDHNLSKKEKVESMKALLTSADAKLEISGSISQLDWINLLMKNSLDLSLSGHGEIVGNVELEKGILVEGSTLQVKPEDLELHLMDYRFHGDGAFSFDVIKGGESPDVKFDLALNNGTMKRHHEKESMIDNVVLNLDGMGKNLSFEGIEKDVELHLLIPTARVKKVSLYNHFLPENAPFKFVDGSAGLYADVVLKSNDAKGNVTFKTDGLTMQVDEQKISARLDANVNIVGGVPRNMDFDISESSIVLDQAKVIGAQTNYDQPDWSARVFLKKADAVWKRPIKLQSETTLNIKDSRPIIAMIDNKREKHGFLSKILTVQDIEGVAKVNIANNVISFPIALLKSDKIDLGAKGIISPALREGMFYLRYKRLKGLLKIRDGKKNFDIFGVQKTFDNYEIPR